MRRSALLFFLLLPSARASAAPHRVDVKIFEGFRAFSLTFLAEEGRYASAAGALRGGADRELSFDYTLTPGADGFVLDFYASLTANGGGPGMSQSGSVTLRPGLRKRVLDCGRWKADLGLDLAAAPAAGRKPADYWLTEKTSGTLGPHRCRHAISLAKGGSVQDFVSSPSGWDRKNIFSVKESFPTLQDGGAGLPETGRYGLTYEVGAGPASVASGTNLILGRAKAVSADGARVELLLTQEPAAAKTKAPAADPAGGEHARVPLLR